MTVLFVCDSGGHLIEANELGISRYPDASIAWYTSDTLMARSLLTGRVATFSRRRVRPGSYWSAMSELATAIRFLRRRELDLVVSSGSAYAFPWLLAARLTRHRAQFIESAARTTNLSRVGRLTSRVPGVQLATQAPLRQDGWEQVPNVLVAAWQRRHQRMLRRPGPPRVLVTVGTFHFPFDRLIDRVDAVTPVDWEIVLQHGASRSIERAVRSEPEVSYDDMVDAMSSADVVISHCGVGTLITAASSGAHCIVMPRRADEGEVVDDHQFDLLSILRSLPGITVLQDASELTTELLCAVVADVVRESIGDD